MRIAERDLKTASGLLAGEDFDWALTVAYNAMLQAARAFMFYKGYRPMGSYRHLAVVHFMECYEKAFGVGEIELFNRIRKRRHIAVYEQPLTVSEGEAERAFDNAKKIVRAARKQINSRA